jgi:ATP-dependent Lon protease
MSPEMVERVLAVARDVSPELAAQLEKMRAESPEQVSQAMRQNARRLMALAVIKERNPDLYAVRVEDARLQLELRKLGDQYRAATQASDAAGAETIAAQIAAKVRAQVDVDLKARAQELVALDEQMQALREELVTEERRTAERVAERIDAVKKGQPIQERGMFGEGGSRRPKPDGADAPKAANPKNSA